MSRQTRVRILSVLVLFVALAGALEKPAAAICCETCPILYERCLAGRTHTYCQKDPSCCATATESCSWTCTYC